jgi:ribosomal protein S18 acetylase RimI-like enzyme
MPDAPSITRFRQLGPRDRPAVARVAAAAFAGNRFYATALGMSADDLPRYWDALFQLLLADPRAAVYALERDASVIAATAVVFPGFPTPRLAARFLWGLVRRLGVRHVVRYLRFVRAYERVMRLPPAEALAEARGYWLFVDPRAAGAGAGSRLVREAMAVVSGLGYTLYTAFVDASNRPLLAFYRRHGFDVLPAFAFFGYHAARIERRRAAPSEPRPC